MNINGKRISAIEVRDKEGVLLALLSDREIVTKGGITVIIKEPPQPSDR